MESNDEEEVRIWERYHAAAKNYAMAIDELVKRHGLVDRDKYKKLTLAVQHAREECERIRLILMTGQCFI